jgi:hypothetical protein
VDALDREPAAGAITRRVDLPHSPTSEQLTHVEERVSHGAAIESSWRASAKDCPFAEFRGGVPQRLR